MPCAGNRWTTRWEDRPEHPDGGRGGSEQWLEAAGSRGWPRSVSWGSLTLTGCDMPNNEFWRFGWPDGHHQAVAGHARAVDRLGHRRAPRRLRRLGPDPLVRRPPPEALATSCPSRRRTTCRWRSSTRSCPFLIIAALFFFTVVVQDKVQERSANPDETIAVKAFKWNWQFVYPDTTGTDGEPVSTVGHEHRDPDPGAADRPDDPLRGRLRRRHPLVLGAGVPLQARRDPGQRERPEQRLRGDRPARRAPTSAAAPSCAARTTRS